MSLEGLAAPVEGPRRLEKDEVDVFGEAREVVQDALPRLSALCLPIQFVRVLRVADWRVSARQPAGPSLCAWDWTLTAVQDVTQAPFVLEMCTTDSCPIVGLQPILDGAPSIP